MLAVARQLIFPALCRQNQQGHIKGEQGQHVLEPGEGWGIPGGVAGQAGEDVSADPQGNRKAQRRQKARLPDPRGRPLDHSLLGPGFLAVVRMEPGDRLDGFSMWAGRIGVGKGGSFISDMLALFSRLDAACRVSIGACPVNDLSALDEHGLGRGQLDRAFGLAGQELGKSVLDPVQV